MIEHKTVSLADQVFEHLETDILAVPDSLDILEQRFQIGNKSH